ncbi:MAG: hypothetical protein U0441_18940 [Polyangiaceae bacterium]
MMRSEDGLKWYNLSTDDGTGCAVDVSDSKRVMLNVQYGAAFVTTDQWDKKIDYTFIASRIAWASRAAETASASSRRPPATRSQLLLRRHVSPVALAGGWKEGHLEAHQPGFDGRRGRYAMRIRRRRG